MKLLIAVLLVLCGIPQAEEIEGKLKTRYDVFGRPVNQQEQAKGRHAVTGETTLFLGIDTVSLNTSVADGRQDVSFISSRTYSGKAWSLNIANRSKLYIIVPLSGRSFIVASSDTTDTATVQFEVEGE